MRLAHSKTVSIIAGILLLGSMSFPSMTQTAEDESLNVSWNKFPVEFYANFSALTDDFEDFMLDAFRAWNRIPDTIIRIEFADELNHTTVTCDAGDCHNGKDLINVIAATLSQDVGGRIPGETFIRCEGSGEVIDGCKVDGEAPEEESTMVEADIVFDGQFLEFWVDNDYNFYKEELTAALMHLIGKALGFMPPADDGTHTNRDEPNCEFKSVMYTDLCRSLTLTDHDIEMVQAKYPSKK